MMDKARTVYDTKTLWGEDPDKKSMFCFHLFEHGLFTNEWETRSRDLWKPVGNQMPGIISKICKLQGRTPAIFRTVGILQGFA